MSEAASERLAAIDIGTNTLLLLIVETAGSELRPVYDACCFGRLGQGLDASGALHADAIARSLDIAREYRATMDELGVSRVAAVGTQALREAKNGAAFVAPAEALLGARIEIISGAREAALVHGAVARSFSDLAGASFVIIDVGGGSTEFIVADASGVQSMTSVPIGSVRLTERHLKADPPTEDEVAALLGGIDDALSSLTLPSGCAVVGTAGTATTLASVALGLEAYDAATIQGTLLARRDVDAQLARYLSLPLSERRTIRGLEVARADVIAAGTAILSRALGRMGAETIRISDRGVRWGLAYELAGSGGWPMSPSLA